METVPNDAYGINTMRNRRAMFHQDMGQVNAGVVRDEDYDEIHIYDDITVI